MNNWNIPVQLENIIRKRDQCCVYCGIKFSNNNRKTAASWEHIINDAKIATFDNIALCCVACNASKGSKLLTDWLQSKYCSLKRINKNTVAEIVKKSL